MEILEEKEKIIISQTEPITGGSVINGAFLNSEWQGFLHRTAPSFSEHSDFPDSVLDTPVQCAEEKYRPAMVEASRKKVREFLGGDPVQNIRSMSAGNRKHTVLTLLRDISGLYGIQPEIKIFWNHRTSGYFHIRSNTLYVNLDYLDDNPQLNFYQRNACCAVFLNMIFHELRHAVQWSFVQNHNSELWGWTEAERERIAYSFRYYISCTRDFGAYRRQLIERDAISFAAQIMRRDAA